MDILWVTRDQKILPGFFTELVAHHIQIFHVQSLDEAEKVCQKHSTFGAVFFDIKDDLEAFDQLRQKNCFDIPFVVYALDTIEKTHMEKALLLGFKTYLNFPPDLNSFLIFIKKVTGEKALGLFKDPSC